MRQISPGQAKKLDHGSLAGTERKRRDRDCMWQEITSGSDWRHFIVLSGHDRIAHEQVKFYRDGQWFVVLDDQGEKHKFCLLHSMKFQ